MELCVGATQQESMPYRDYTIMSDTTNSDTVVIRALLSIVPLWRHYVRGVPNGTMRLVKDVVVLLRPLQKGYYIVVPQKVSQIPLSPFWNNYVERPLLDHRRQLRQQETIQRLDTPHSNQHSNVVDNTTYRWVAKVAIVSATRSVWP